MLGIRSAFRLRLVTTETRRRFAGKGAPSSRNHETKGIIPAQVAVFSLLLIPCIAYAAVFYRGMDERREALEETIRERYSDKVREVSSKNDAIFDFIDQVTNAKPGPHDERIQQVLYAGKDEKKRLYPVNKDLYGTSRGVEERKKTEEELALEEEKRKERRRRRKAKREAQAEEAIAAETKAETQAYTVNGVNLPKAAVAVSVAALAVTAGFFLGGSRR